jgi:uncharacterized protein YacL (UPF0231 family)
MKLELYRDETGEPRARGHGRYARLAAFLESDVQGSRTLLRRIARAVEAVEGGKEERWEETGNAHTLTLTRAGARLQSEVDSAGGDEAVEVSLADLRAALGLWAELLASDGER